MIKPLKQSKIPKKLKTTVLICDSLTNQLSSFPACLHKISQIPLISYTIHWLVQSNIQQLFILYCKHKQQIQQFFTTYGKSLQIKYQLQYVKQGQLKSFGDAIREIQFRNLVNQDFLILYGDSIMNFNLSKMIHSHFLKKQQLKSVVLTTAFQQGYAKNIHILNSNTGQILHIQQDIQKQFILNTEKINLKKVNIDFRRDIVPIDVFICTVEVLKSFKESYQYTTMNQFIIGMLTSDVYEEKMNAYILGKEERCFRGSRASGLFMIYSAFIRGYLSPYTINNQQELQPRQRQLRRQITPFTVRQFNKIIKKGCIISDKSRLSNNIYIGQNCIIQQKTTITNSIILKKCKISSGISLSHCILMQGIQLKSTTPIFYQYCKFQFIGNTLKISSFKLDIIQRLQSQDILIDRPLFQQTPNQQQDDIVNYQQDLVSLLKDQPNGNSVTDLFTLRKCHNKELKQFMKDMVRILEPNGIKGVQMFVEKWGSILLKLHDQEELVLGSLSYTCEQLQKYQKAMHVFLQYLYYEEILTKQPIKKWFEGKNIDASLTLSLCKPFLEKLDQQSQDEEEGEDQDQEEEEQ